MQTGQIGFVVNTFKELPFAEKEFALEILEKQMIEERRKLLANRVKEARANYRSRKVKEGTLKELLKDLNSD